MMNVSAERCPECGQGLELDAPDGLCPACLLEMAMVETPDSVDDSRTTNTDFDGQTSHSLLSRIANSCPADDFKGASTDRDLGENRAGTTTDLFGGVSSSPIVEPVAPPGYVILEKLGIGGMGVVYKAKHEGLDRLVALKMIRDQAHARSDQLARFRIEAEVVARIRHVNIVHIYDVGETDGVRYLSLELLEGGSLADRIDGTPQSPQFSAPLLAQLARAIQEAHAAGIIHRDLKPQNVLFDHAGTPKITDFGLAKRLDVEGGLTLSDAVMGTPSYMAPEQAMGKNRQVGPPADIYALGAILYAMLTGRPPLQGTSLHETLLMVVGQEPVPPSKLQPKIPQDLETICLKCLHKDPQRRYESAEALADDLDRFLNNRPVLARRTPVWERGLKWVRRHPTAATLVALGMTFAIGLGFVVERSNQAFRLRASQERQRIGRLRLESLDDLRKGQEQLARGELEEARVSLSQLETRLQPEPALEDLRSGASAALSEIGRRLEDRSLREAGRARLARFEVLFDEAMLQDAPVVGFDAGGQSGLARLSAKRALEVFGAFDGTGAWSMGSLPVSLSVRDREKVSSGCYLMLMVLAEATARPLPGEDAHLQAVEALRWLDRASTLKPLTRAYHARRASCLERAGESEAAVAERAKIAQVEPSEAFDHLLLGQQLYREGDVSGALRQFASVLQQRPDFSAAFLSASALLNSSPPKPAEAWAMLNLCLQQKPDYAWLYLLRGAASGQIGALALRSERDRTRSDSQVAEAEAHFEAAEADFRQAMTMGLTPDLRYSLFLNRGSQRFQRGRSDEAISDFKEAEALDSSRYSAYASLSTVMAQSGRKAEAIEQLNRAIERKPDLAILYRRRAELRVKGDSSPAAANAAISDLDQAIRCNPPRSRDTGSDHAGRGHLLLGLHRYEEALAACDAALKIDPKLAAASRDRCLALLNLGRFDDVLASCDVALSSGSPSAEMYELRGLARVGRNKFAEAIEDYTHALGLHPRDPQTLLRRGRAYLFANSPELALRDFEDVVRLVPDQPEGYAGRASAKVRLRRHQEATEDANEAVRRIAKPTPVLFYEVARTFAQASVVAASEVDRRGRPALTDSRSDQARAIALLIQALELTPADGRGLFWRQYVEDDPVLATIRKQPEVIRWLRSTAASNR